MTRAAVQLKADGPIEFIEVDVRPPGPGEVRVRMAAAGLCHTDVQALYGGVAGMTMPPPAVAGHEGAGVVTEVGPGVLGPTVGDHVILSATGHDGTCEFCTDGHPSLCLRSLQLADPRTGNGPALSVDGTPVTPFGPLGTFTEETIVPAECAIAIDKAMPLDLACLIGCAVSTGVGAVRNRVTVRPGDHVAVLGCGGVGLNIVQAARRAGAGSVIAVDVSEEKLTAATAFGATHVIDARHVQVPDAVRAVTGPFGAHFTFESTGLTDCMAQAVSAIRPGGTAVLLGMAPGSSALALDNIADIILQEKVITGSLMGSGYSVRDFPVLVREYLEGTLKLDELITRRRPLAEINEAIADLKSGTGLRTVFTF